MLKLNILKIAGALAVLTAMASAANAQTINQRLHNQNRRIDNGIKDRQLNKYQAGALHAKDRQIHAEERYDRLTDHGRLTGRERAGLERQLNRNSRRIYNQKHNQ